MFFIVALMLSNEEKGGRRGENRKRGKWGVSKGKRGKERSEEGLGWKRRWKGGKREHGSGRLFLRHRDTWRTVSGAEQPPETLDHVKRNRQTDRQTH